MKIITISGLDGSGKSTQIELLKKYLETNGKKVFYFHAIEFSLANKISKSTNKKESKSVTKAGSFTIWLRKIFLKIDTKRFKCLVRKLEKEGYDYLISDRYFYDSVINIEFLSDLTSDVRNFLTSDVRKPVLAIYLQASPETIMSRERIPDQGVEYLKKKKELYDAKTSIWNWKVVDGNRDKNVIFEEIKSYV